MISLNYNMKVLVQIDSELRLVNITKRIQQTNQKICRKIFTHNNILKMIKKNNIKALIFNLKTCKYMKINKGATKRKNNLMYSQLNIRIYKL